MSTVPPELIPMPTVKTSNADELNPALKMPFGGTVGTMLISANGKWLYVLNVAENKILRIDTTTLKVTHEMLPKATIEAMAFSADAKLLITIGTLEGKCVVNGFDAATLKESMAYGLPIVPFDLFVGADEVAYISGTLDGRSFVVALPLTGDNPIQRWETVGGQAFPRFMADQKRLLVRSGEGDGRLESWSFGADGKRLPKITAVFGTADSSFAGEPFVLPSGKAMMFRSGAIVRLSPGQEDDLQTVRTIEPFVSATADTQGSIFTITTTGDVKAYVPGTWAEKGSYRLRGMPYQVLYHAGTGRLYVAMLDPSSLTSRPRVRGFGEIWAIDMKPTVAAK